MLINFVKKSSKLLLACAVVASIGAGQAFGKPKSELIKEEDGFYYGYGTASTNAEALAIAKKDLIESALTSTLRILNPIADRVTVSDESAKERLSDIKPIYPNKKSDLKVVYKVSVKEWEKDCKAYDEKLRKSLNPKYQSIIVKGAAGEKLETAAAILNELAEKGVYDLLTLQAGATELYSKKVEGVCRSILNNLVITVETKNCIAGPSTVFAVKAADKTGAAVPNLTLKAKWEVAALPITTSSEEVEEVISFVKTGADGKAEVSYPVAEEYLGKTVCLTVSTAISSGEHVTKEMRKIDAESAVEGHYAYFDNLETAFASVAVEAGEYKTGAVSSDKRAGSKEAERTVTLSAYSIDLNPVTNAQFAAFLYITGSESYPEYFDNSDYNQDNQPVVGVSAKDAEAYAAWLSEQTGAKYRLPTDDEWEVAARAGVDCIFPWGNESPAKTKSANFKGNGQFKTPSPVGSFMSGANSWGLVDMSGNVWEWTSTAREADEGMRTVKGGSWMDGPMDLRISNFKNIDAEVGTPDVGFRLVKEM